MCKRMEMITMEIMMGKTKTVMKMIIEIEMMIVMMKILQKKM